MAVRPIDGAELIGIERLLDTDVVRKSKTASWLLDQVLHDIQAMPTLTPPNELLTLEELRDMDGEPVYVVISGVDTLKMWALVEVVKDMKCVILTNNLGGRSEYYDDDELKYDGIKVYRHPPEESR